jgi:hypothetical protein
MIVGLLSPRPAGGDRGVVVAASGLFLASLCYIAGRVAPDRRLHPLWRAALILSVMASLIATIGAIYEQQDYGGFFAYWYAYRRLPVPWQYAAWSILVFAALNIGAALDVRRRTRNRSSASRSA